MTTLATVPGGEIPRHKSWRKSIRKGVFTGAANTGMGDVSPAVAREIYGGTEKWGPPIPAPESGSERRSFPRRG